MEKIDFTFDTQMIVEGENVKIKEIKRHLSHTFEGDCLLVVGDDGFARVHFHTNEPWEIMSYLSKLGTIYDIVIENMEKQAEEFNNGIK